MRKRKTMWTDTLGFRDISRISTPIISGKKKIKIWTLFRWNRLANRIDLVDFYSSFPDYDTKLPPGKRGISDALTRRSLVNNTESSPRYETLKFKIKFAFDRFKS